MGSSWLSEVSALGWRGAALAAALAVALAAQDPAPHLFDGQDKLEHVAVFLVLASAFCWRLRGLPFWSAGAAAGALAFGVELLQGLYVPSRVASFWDGMAGFAGAGLGMALAALANQHLGPVRATKPARGLIRPPLARR